MIVDATADSLKGLPAELRKAAKTTTEIIELERSALNIRSMDRYQKFHAKLWLPAGLVGKEIRRIKGFQKDVIIDFLNRLRETCGFNICEEHNRARFNCPDYIKLLDEYGITYEKLKRKRED